MSDTRTQNRRLPLGKRRFWVRALGAMSALAVAAFGRAGAEDGAQQARPEPAALRGFGAVQRLLELAVEEQLRSVPVVVGVLDAQACGRGEFVLRLALSGFARGDFGLEGRGRLRDARFKARLLAQAVQPRGRWRRARSGRPAWRAPLHRGRATRSPGCPGAG